MYVNYRYPNNNYDNRFANYDNRFGGFFVPFLLGGLGGAAVVGLSRPRPVVYNPTPQYPYPSPYPYYYGY